MDIMSLTPDQLDRYIHVQSIVDRQNADHEKVLALRDYYYGNHPVYLTQRQQEYLGEALTEGEFKFAHNLIRSVVDTLRERLDVTGFDTVREDDAEDELGALLWEWWQTSRLDSQQIRLYRRALRDGKSYLIVDYDAEAGAPRFSLHKVDDGKTGIVLHRDPTDPSRVLYASRYFYTFDPLTPGATGIERKTVYLPHEIRKFVRGKQPGTWLPVQDEGDASWPIPWRDLAGKPLGVAVIEFENPGGSEIEQIVGLQNGLNKAWLDLLAAADTSGFPLIAIEYNDAQPFGAMDDDDITGSDELRFSPGRAIEVANAQIKRIEGSNLQPMIDVIWALTAAISGVSRTPQYYLRPIGGADVPSGEALKQLESGLVRRAQERQQIFGQAWADAMTLALRLESVYGALAGLPTPLHVDVKWSDAEVRNEAVQSTIAQNHKALGVPDAEVWRLLGYSPEQIEAFRTALRDDRAADIATIATAIGSRPTPTATPTAPTNGNGNQQPATVAGRNGAGQ